MRCCGTVLRCWSLTTVRPTALPSCCRAADVRRVTHEKNRGYGRACDSAFEYTLAHGYEVLVTIDCDGQHSPQRIPLFVAAARGCRHRLRQPLLGKVRRRQPAAGRSPQDQRRGHGRIEQPTRSESDRRILRIQGLSRRRPGTFDIKEPGYAMPLELWVQAAHAKLRIVELRGAVDLFGGGAFFRRIAGRRPDAAAILS